MDGFSAQILPNQIDMRGGDLQVQAQRHRSRWRLTSIHFVDLFDFGFITSRSRRDSDFLVIVQVRLLHVEKIRQLSETKNQLLEVESVSIMI